MSCQKHQQIRATAIEMRRGGASRREIAEALNIGEGSSLGHYLRDIPPHPKNIREYAPPELREKALQMRREGRSYRELEETLGVTRGMMSNWLRTAPELRVRRTRSPGEGKDAALKMRLEGKTYSEIRAELGVSKGTLSGWLQNVPLTDEQRASIESKRFRGSQRAGATLRARRIARVTSIREVAAAEIKTITDEQLFLMGVVLYWAEGTKTKPWSDRVKVTFANSDPRMILIFIAWLELLGIGRDRLRPRLQIHERADIAEAISFWSRLTGVPLSEFGKTTLKRHNPKTRRRNVGERYRGCLNITVLRGTDLSHRIEAWFESISSVLFPGGVIR